MMPNKNLSEYIKPLEVDGLKGRVLRLPAPNGSSHKLLFVYGQHSSIERWQGIARVFNRYAAVTVPDLPGLGGMDSLYKIGKTPTIDTLADYLAEFVRKEYKDGQKFTISAMSLGFVVATRMLQRHPDITAQTKSLISVVGFAHHSDFRFAGIRMSLYKLASVIFSRRLPAYLFRKALLNSVVLRRAYHRTRNAKEKFESAGKEQFEQTMQAEITLWKINDIRTQFKTYQEMFALDNTRQRVELAVNHVSVATDRYFDSVKVAKHMNQIFASYHDYPSTAPSHAPTIVADEAEAERFFPEGLLEKIFLKNQP